MLGKQKPDVDKSAASNGLPFPGEATMSHSVKASRDNAERYLLSVKEASGWLGISVFTLYSWAQGKKLPHYKIGKKVMFSKDDLKRWLEKHRVTSVG